MTSTRPASALEIAQAAARLAGATASGSPCSPIRDLIGRTDIDSAYQIQTINVQSAVDTGKILSGRKIGLTSPAVQAQLGVDQPDFGVLFADMDCTGDTEVGFSRLLQPRIEAEIAFILSKDIADTITEADAPTFVDRVAAAFEIVDSRIADWDISLADTVADNASSGLYVLGESKALDQTPELAAVEMTMSKDDTQVSAGKGSDCLGSPWSALVWLANTSLSYGSPLRAGEVILSGALGPMVPVTPGATYTAHITGIGEVRAAFTQ